MSYTGWQERLRAEADDLREKTMKLEAFVSTEAHAALDAMEQCRLFEQLEHMREYLKVLERRIAAHSGAVE